MPLLCLLFLGRGGRRWRLQWLEERWRGDASEEKAHTCSMAQLSSAKSRGLSGTKEAVEFWDVMMSIDMTLLLTLARADTRRSSRTSRTSSSCSVTSTTLSPTISSPLPASSSLPSEPPGASTTSLPPSGYSRVRFLPIAASQCPDPHAHPGAHTNTTAQASTPRSRTRANTTSTSRSCRASGKSSAWCSRRSSSPPARKRTTSRRTL